MQRLAYDAWGRRRQASGTEYASGTVIATPPTTRGYTDHEHVDDVGLINMNARIYDPEVGRFMSPDSIIPNVFQSQALNRYSYVYNNPTSMTDPSGHQPVPGFSVNYGYVPFTGNPYIDVPVNIILAVLPWLRGSDDNKPLPHHYRDRLRSMRT